jgi:hypothetical protein
VVIKHLIYIVVLIVSSVVYTNNNNHLNSEIKPSTEEVHSCSDFIHSFADEFADETEDDSKKHTFLLQKETGIIRNLGKKSNQIVLNHSADRILLLNAYLDLPPPVIS